MQASNLSLSVHDPVLIYTFLAMYGILTVAILLYVQGRFRQATKALTVLKTEWDTAEARHAGFVGKARADLSKLSVPVAPVAAPVRAVSVNLDTRKQVVAMGKKGFAALEIAKTCGLLEGDVDVLLGMARLQR